MAVKQLSVFVENKPGKLSEKLGALAEKNINIRAMNIADTKDFGILRLIVSDVETAKAALSETSLVTITDVVAVEMKDKSGALYDILNVLGGAGINIEYMYAFTMPSNLGAYVFFRVEDCEKTEAVLKANGLKVTDKISE